MDFRKATDDLCDGLSHEELAKALGVSIASIRQARLKSDANAHRTPPQGWEKKLIHLAQERMSRYRKLIKELSDQRSDSVR